MKVIKKSCIFSTHQKEKIKKYNEENEEKGKLLYEFIKKMHIYLFWLIVSFNLHVV